MGYIEVILYCIYLTNLEHYFSMTVHGFMLELTKRKHV
jgi:hypothetical protein